MCAPRWPTCYSVSSPAAALGRSYAPESPRKGKKPPFNGFSGNISMWRCKALIHFPIFVCGAVRRCAVSDCATCIATRCRCRSAHFDWAACGFRFIRFFYFSSPPFFPPLQVSVRLCDSNSLFHGLSPPNCLFPMVPRRTAGTRLHPSTQRRLAT